MSQVRSPELDTCQIVKRLIEVVAVMPSFCQKMSVSIGISENGNSPDRLIAYRNRNADTRPQIGRKRWYGPMRNLAGTQNHFRL